MNPGVIEQILDAYGIVPMHIRAPQKGYRNSSYAIRTNDGWRNLILYKREPEMLPRIKRAHLIADTLAADGLPIRQTADPRIMTLRSNGLIRYAALYTYLPGTTIPWEAYTMNHLKLVGMAMSTMHARLAGMEPLANSVSDEYRELLERMRIYFERTGVQKAMQSKLGVQVDDTLFDHYARLLRLSSCLPHQQNLHMDFVRGNLLFARAVPRDMFVMDHLALSGIIDFEKVAYGHPVFDIARTLAFLLVDCKHKSPDKIAKYFLTSGYGKRGESTLSNVAVRDGFRTYDLLQELTGLFLAHDFYKFLRHNPYESLHENEHFIRTRDALITRANLRLVN